MLSKVANRVKRHSVVQQTPWLEQGLQRPVVDSAPDLVRWCDPSDPFPSVTFGGYSRYYKTRSTTIDSSSQAEPDYCPLLCQRASSSSSSKIPLLTTKAPLFPIASKRCLSVIHEASMESITPRRTRNLSIATSTDSETSPRSLRRKKARLLRTPSIERDFAEHIALGRNSFWANISITSEDTTSIGSNTGSGVSSMAIVIPVPRSHNSSHSPSSDSHSHSSVSEFSSQFDANYAEYPMTPATSVGSEDDSEGELFMVRKEDENFKACNILAASCSNRPESRSSFSTAKSAFSERD